MFLGDTEFHLFRPKGPGISLVAHAWNEISLVAPLFVTPCGTRRASDWRRRGGKGRNEGGRKTVGSVTDSRFNYRFKIIRDSKFKRRFKIHWEIHKMRDSKKIWIWGFKIFQKVWFWTWIPIHESRIVPALVQVKVNNSGNETTVDVQLWFVIWSVDCRVLKFSLLK